MQSLRFALLIYMYKWLFTLTTLKPCSVRR